MRKSNRQSIEDFGEDDMPCPCTVCNEWFDLNDGKEHPRKENHVICASCANAIQIEVDREEEIEELQSIISDAEYTIKDAQKRLKELGAPIEGEEQRFTIEESSQSSPVVETPVREKEEIFNEIYERIIEEEYADRPNSISKKLILLSDRERILKFASKVYERGINSTAQLKPVGDKEEHKWISVKDKLPNKSPVFPGAGQYNVLAATNKGRVYETSYCSLGWANQGFETVTHWMPLPSPPKV